MNFEEMARNIAKSDMDVNLKIAEVLKIKDENQKQINITSNAKLYCFMAGILIFPLLVIPQHTKNLKILRQNLEGVNDVLYTLKAMELNA